MKVKLKVNGKLYTVNVFPTEMLVNVIRNKIGLTGTKRGCDTAGCGACTVLIDGRAVYSCITFALMAGGHEITTIEGLSQSGELDPVQRAFIEHGAAQCGFCTPGLIMAARSLLNSKKDLGEKDVHEAIAGNLCRCTGYVRVVQAILAAGRKI